MSDNYTHGEPRPPPASLRPQGSYLPHQTRTAAGGGRPQTADPSAAYRSSCRGAAVTRPASGGDTAAAAAAAYHYVLTQPGRASRPSSTADAMRQGRTYPREKLTRLGRTMDPPYTLQLALPDSSTNTASDKYIVAVPPSSSLLGSGRELNNNNNSGYYKGSENYDDDEEEEMRWLRHCVKKMSSDLQKAREALSRQEAEDQLFRHALHHNDPARRGWSKYGSSSHHDHHHHGDDEHHLVYSDDESLTVSRSYHSTTTATTTHHHHPYDRLSYSSKYSDGRHHQQQRRRDVRPPPPLSMNLCGSSNNCNNNNNTNNEHGGYHRNNSHNSLSASCSSVTSLQRRLMAACHVSPTTAEAVAHAARLVFREGEDGRPLTASARHHNHHSNNNNNHNNNSNHHRHHHGSSRRRTEKIDSFGSAAAEPMTLQDYLQQQDDPLHHDMISHQNSNTLASKSQSFSLGGEDGGYRDHDGGVMGDYDEDDDDDDDNTEEEGVAPLPPAATMSPVENIQTAGPSPICPPVVPLETEEETDAMAERSSSNKNRASLERSSTAQHHNGADKNNNNDNNTVRASAAAAAGGDSEPGTPTHVMKITLEDLLPTPRGHSKMYNVQSSAASGCDSSAPSGCRADVEDDSPAAKQPVFSDGSDDDEHHHADANGKHVDGGRNDEIVCAPEGVGVEMQHPLGLPVGLQSATSYTDSSHASTKRPNGHHRHSGGRSKHAPCYTRQPFLLAATTTTTTTTNEYLAGGPQPPARRRSSASFYSNMIRDVLDNKNNKKNNNNNNTSCYAGSSVTGLGASRSTTLSHNTRRSSASVYSVTNNYPSETARILRENIREVRHGSGSGNSNRPRTASHHAMTTVRMGVPKPQPQQQQAQDDNSNSNDDEEGEEEEEESVGGMDSSNVLFAASAPVVAPPSLLPLDFHEVVLKRQKRNIQGNE